MKAKLRTGLFALVCVTAMTACGGSGDDGAGQLSDYQLSPTEVSLEAGCSFADVKVADVLVLGGTAPYTAYSPNDQRITFGPAGSTAPTRTGTFEIANRNSRFAVFASGCVDIDVSVLDAQGRTAKVKVSVTAASGAGS